MIFLLLLLILIALTTTGYAAYLAGLTYADRTKGRYRMAQTTATARMEAATRAAESFIRDTVK